MAHILMHRYAEFVSGLYGCWMKWDTEQGRWFDTCALSHAHNPYGLSAGFTATWLCSICREEISECVHHGLAPYTVTASRYDDEGKDTCSVCHETACDHIVGEAYEVWQTWIMHNPTMHEATLTLSPREPRARLTEMEMDPQPAPPWKGYARIRCRRCLIGCGGLREAEPPRPPDAARNGPGPK
jgi:hypothetical protein